MTEEPTEEESEMTKNVGQQETPNKKRSNESEKTSPVEETEEGYREGYWTQRKNNGWWSDKDQEQPVDIWTEDEVKEEHRRDRE